MSSAPKVPLMLARKLEASLGVLGGGGLLREEARNFDSVFKSMPNSSFDYGNPYCGVTGRLDYFNFQTVQTFYIFPSTMKTKEPLAQNMPPKS